MSKEGKLGLEAKAPLPTCATNKLSHRPSMATLHQISDIVSSSQILQPRGKGQSLELCDWNIKDTPQWLLGFTRAVQNSPCIVCGPSPFTTTKFSTFPCRLDNRAMWRTRTAKTTTAAVDTIDSVCSCSASFLVHPPMQAKDTACCLSEQAPCWRLFVESAPFLPLMHTEHMLKCHFDIFFSFHNIGPVYNDFIE
jgi:hypothetical protein